MKPLLILYSFTLILLTSCSGSSKKQKDEKRLVTVTLEPQRFFAEAIAGDKWNINSMVPKGSSPETYDPTPQQLAKLSKSDAYLRIGYIGFELSWMERLTDNAPHMHVFNTSKGIDLIYGSNNGEEDSHHHSGGIEPHIWNSTINARIIAKNMLNSFCTLDKGNRSYYLKRYDSLCLRIDHTDSLIRKILSSPETDHAFMIYHPALSYFARDYGLHQICIEEGGKEPSPSHLQKLIDICKAEGVRIIFVQPEFDRRNAEIIAKQTGTKIISVNPLAYDWEKEMIHIAKSLCR
ncbi:metal ABC transporter solute-binding protein, Zn/Mn family [uncultured Bacteroides sp.]|uniref:metal ABC transporter solute-binding protein, Zn/Mn family n=1 Tax=uncultured Bacteroides sp. TaxID=162156 RepID=UPI002AA6EF5D|nr:zinc ABC transporter substrate-binding protein [uncultured Bacteroides sp.]